MNFWYHHVPSCHLYSILFHRFVAGQSAALEVLLRLPRHLPFCGGCERLQAVDPNWAREAQTTESDTARIESRGQLPDNSRNPQLTQQKQKWQEQILPGCGVQSFFRPKQKHSLPSKCSRLGATATAVAFNSMLWTHLLVFLQAVHCISGPVSHFFQLPSSTCCLVTLAKKCKTSLQSCLKFWSKSKMSGLHGEPTSIAVVVPKSTRQANSIP